MLDIKRPKVPDWILETFDDCFVPSLELDEFVRSTFLNEKHPLYHEEHIHLTQATIGYLWTNVPNSRNGQRIAGTAEMPMVQGGKWVKARAMYQIAKWFAWYDEEIDFLITLDARWFAEQSDISFCAALEHELFHCGQEMSIYGSPKFYKNGRPKFAIRGHDVEEFVAIWERYGVNAGAGKSKELFEAGKKKPQFSGADIEIFCGNCMGLKK